MFDIVISNKQVRITLPESTFTSDTPQVTIERAKAFMEHAGLVPFEATVDEHYKPNKATRRGEVSCVFNYTIEFKSDNIYTFDLARALSVVPMGRDWHIECPKRSVLIINKNKLAFELGIIKGQYAGIDYTVTFNKSTGSSVWKQATACRLMKYDGVSMDPVANALILKETETKDGDPISGVSFKARPVFVEYNDRLFFRSGGPVLSKGSLVLEYDGRSYPVGNAHEEVMWILKDETNSSHTDIKAETMIDVINYTATLIPINAIAVNFEAPEDVNDWFLLEKRCGLTEVEAQARYLESALIDSVSAFVIGTRGATSAKMHELVDEIVKEETSEVTYQRYMRDAVTTDLTGVPMSSVNRTVRQPTLEPSRGVPSPAAIFDAVAHYIQTGRYDSIADVFTDIVAALKNKREWTQFVTPGELETVAKVFSTRANEAKPASVGEVIILADVMIETIRNIVSNTPVADLRGRINVGECVDILTDIDKHIRNEIMKTPIVWF